MGDPGPSHASKRLRFRLRRPDAGAIVTLRLGFLLAAALSLLEAPSPGYFQQDVEYTIRARLNAKEHTLTGHSTIRYTNHAPEPLAELYLHLYPNTYKDRFSTAAR